MPFPAARDSPRLTQTTVEHSSRRIPEAGFLVDRRLRRSLSGLTKQAEEAFFGCDRFRNAEFLFELANFFG